MAAGYDAENIRILRERAPSSLIAHPDRPVPQSLVRNSNLNVLSQFCRAATNLRNRQKLPEEKKSLELPNKDAASCGASFRRVLPRVGHRPNGRRWIPKHPALTEVPNAEKLTPL